MSSVIFNLFLFAFHLNLLFFFLFYSFSLAKHPRTNPSGDVLFRSKITGCRYLFCTPAQKSRLHSSLLKKMLTGFYLTKAH